MEHAAASRSSSTCSSPGTCSPGRTQRLKKFNIDEDLALLTQVVAEDDAFAKTVTHPTWRKIAESVGRSQRMAGVSPRACKERAEKVVRQARAKDNWRARQSGTAEQYSEKERLLLEAVELFEEKERRKEMDKESKDKSRERKDRDYSEAIKIRDGALKTLGSKRRFGDGESSEEEEDGLNTFDEDGPSTATVGKTRTKAVRASKKKKQPKSSTETIVDYLREKDRGAEGERKDALQGMKEREEREEKRRVDELQLMKDKAEMEDKRRGEELQLQKDRDQNNFEIRQGEMQVQRDILQASSDERKGMLDLMKAMCGRLGK